MIVILENEVFGGIPPFQVIYDLKQIGYGASTPEPKLNMIEVPGRNGLLDLTNALGPVTYSNRQVWGSFREYGDVSDHIDKYSEIMNRFHGQRVKVVLDAEPDYYYDGRCTVSTEYTDSKSRLINIAVDADPLKYPVYASDEDWLWDPFNFNTGVIRNYKNITINGTQSVYVIAYDQPESPKFRVSLMAGQSSMRMMFDNEVYYLNNGVNVFPEISIRSADVYTDIHEFTFSGYGTVSIDMKGGIL